MVTTKSPRARDLMRREVLTLSPDDSIATALTMFEDARISGAPVVSAAGRMLGVLTLRDVGRPEHLDGSRIAGDDDRARADRDDDVEPGEVFYLREDYEPEVLGKKRVADWMTDSVITVEPDATLHSICRTMAAAGIHRVFVTERERLVGVISSFDVIRWLARA